MRATKNKELQKQFRIQTSMGLEQFLQILMVQWWPAQTVN